jgi:MFS family permease
LSQRYKWYLVAILWWISFFNYADRQALAAVGPLLQTDLQLSNEHLGWLGSSFGLAYGLCAPLAGYVVDRVRRKSAILGGLYIWSVICMATALCTRFWSLLAFRAAEGLGEAFYYPASTSLISAYHGMDTRSRGLGIHQTSVYVGTIAGGFFAAYIGERYGWRWSFVVFGGLGILLGFVVSRWVIEPATQSADAEKAAPMRMPLSAFLRTLAASPTVPLLMAAFVCANYVAMVLLFWMPKFLYDEFHLSLPMAGFVATIYVQVASMAGAPLGGWLADLLRRRTPAGRMWVQALGVLAGAPCVVLCAQAPSLAWLIVALIAWGLFKGIYDANIFASVFDVIRPEARGTAAGFMNMVGWLGGGVSGPLVIGMLADRYSFRLAISSTAPVYLVAAGLLGAAGMVFQRRAGLVPSLESRRDD